MSSIITAPHKVRSSRTWQQTKHEPQPITITRSDGSVQVISGAVKRVQRKINKPKKSKKSTPATAIKSFTTAEHNSAMEIKIADQWQKILSSLGSIHQE